MSDLFERLDQPQAEGWRPEVDDKIVGHVVDTDVSTAGEYGEYPIITIRRQDGTETAVHCFHTVLKNLVTNKKPQVGDYVGIKYKGVTTPEKGGKDYEDYRMILARKGSDENPKMPARKVTVSADEPF